MQITWEFQFHITFKEIKKNYKVRKIPETPTNSTRKSKTKQKNTIHFSDKQVVTMKWLVTELCLCFDLTRIRHLNPRAKDKIPKSNRNHQTNDSRVNNINGYCNGCWKCQIHVTMNLSNYQISRPGVLGLTIMSNPYFLVC